MWNYSNTMTTNTNTILFGGPYGDMYKRVLSAINEFQEHERTPMRVYLLIDELRKTSPELADDGREWEKCRNAMIARVEPFIYYGRCDGCGSRLQEGDDSFCTRACEGRWYLD